MKAFTPTQVKADLILILGVAATFGLKLTETQQIAVLSGATVICVALNFAEAHIKVNAGVLAAVEKALAEIKALLAKPSSLVAEETQATSVEHVFPTRQSPMRKGEP